VKPEADLHLAKARQSLAKARAMLAIELADEAGRAAYLAAFHAAQAFIFDRTGRTPKTHQGVRAQFGTWARQEAGITLTLRRFLTDGYDLKTVADYAIGPQLRRCSSIVSTRCLHCRDVGPGYALASTPRPRSSAAVR
jgi:uncharacterized protein (UPF0332 family)